jgi:hypothetical protein
LGLAGPPPIKAHERSLVEFQIKLGTGDARGGFFARSFARTRLDRLKDQRRRTLHEERSTWR